jgi:hypothetical protein
MRDEGGLKTGPQVLQLDTEAMIRVEFWCFLTLMYLGLPLGAIVQ